MESIAYAVMSRRTEPKDSLDNFPTPPWAVRALLEHVIRYDIHKGMSCLEPACGNGHMSTVLKEGFDKVISSDIRDYGNHKVRDFLSGANIPITDWIITNPPFCLAQEFALRAIKISRIGVALFTRTAFIESVGRYDNLLNVLLPTTIAQFVERVHIVKGRLDRYASTATGYCWIVWRKSTVRTGTQLMWIPPCRHRLEFDTDYPIYNAIMGVKGSDMLE
jgi:hypothetical protein